MRTDDFTNEYGANIHQSIQAGKTVIFDSEFKAQDYARRIRRYHYPVYENGKSNGHYAVPL